MLCVNHPIRKEFYQRKQMSHGREIITKFRTLMFTRLCLVQVSECVDTDEVRSHGFVNQTMCPYTKSILTISHPINELTDNDL